MYLSTVLRACKKVVCGIVLLSGDVKEWDKEQLLPFWWCKKMERKTTYRPVNVPIIMDPADVWFFSVFRC